MPLVSWLLRRVSAVENEEVEINQLYDSFKFECLEDRIPETTSKRTLVETLIKLFPTVQKERQNISKTKRTVYRGICLRELGPVVSQRNNFSEVKTYLPEMFKIKEENVNQISCAVETGYFANGNKITKTVIFNRDLTWKFQLSQKEVDLSKLLVQNTYQVDKFSIENVCKAVTAFELCSGVQLAKTTVITRFHVIEKWKKDNGPESKKVHSLVCSKVVPLNSVSNVCRKCQKMTMDNKENCNTSENQTTQPDTVLSKVNILKMIPGATEEMVELLMHQGKNSSTVSHGRRWSKSIISVCLQWYSRSPQSYEAFRAGKYLILPSTSTLVAYKNKVKQEVGFHENIFLWMHQEAIRQGIHPDGWTGGIILDEMAIQSDIQINMTGDVVELTGLVDLGEEGNLCHTLRTGKNQKILGTHALQLVFLGLTGFRFPFAHFISDQVQAPELYGLFWDAVDKLQMYGFTAIYTCMDGAQCNRSFMHFNIGKESNTFITQNPCNLNSMIFMMDVSHVLKKIRNNVLKSGITKHSTRLLTLENGNTIQWQMFIDCFRWDQSNSFQLHRKLTNEHLFPSNQAKMRNHLAEDVLDSEMLHLMSQYQCCLGEKGSVLNGVIEFLRITSKLINIFRDMRPIRSPNDTRLDNYNQVSDWFTTWKITMYDNNTNKQKLQNILSLQCHEDIESCAIAFIQLCRKVLKEQQRIYITPGLVNSDVIENTFNQQRSTYNGANTNPNASQYRQTINSIILGQNCVSVKANAGRTRLPAMPYQPASAPKSRKRPDLSSTYGSLKKIKVLRL